jgi:hypothetical protein
VHRHGCRHREQLPDADGLGAEGVLAWAYRRRGRSAARCAGL